jgi:rfaE bifunctional protein kinase chain/domain/rfaE bifunctional protein nucleotidyltransferase chain/domain
MNATRKICSLEQLLNVRRLAREAGKTVVHCHGCFDIVHPGHIHYLDYAKSLGDILIVSVSSDDHVSKGVDRPLVPDDLRARNLAALEVVDHVYLNPQATSVQLLEQLQPDIYVKGREYERSADPRFLAERDTVIRVGGRVIFSGGDVVYSSTSLIGAMADANYFQDEKLRRFRERYELSAMNLANLVRRFADQRVVVVGDYIQDRYHFCEALGIAGEAPVMSLRSLKTADYDGGAGIVAQHVAGLGASATLVTTHAPDAMWHDAQRRMTDAGVNVLGIETRRQTVCKERYLVDDTKVFRVETGAPSPLDQQHQALLAATILEAARGADAVIFTDFGYGTITGSLCDAILPELRKTVRTIAADISGSQSSLLKFRGVDLITPTEREARQTIGEHGMGLGAAVSRLLQTLSMKQAIITLGKQGLVCFDRPADQVPSEQSRLRSEYIPALTTQAVDPLGCGDALLSTAALTLAAGGSLQAASLLGSYAASIEVQKLGNHPLRAGALLERVVEPSVEPRRIAV